MAGNKTNKDQIYILGENTPFVVQEAYKNLRTNVQFSLPAEDSHVIGVTSAERGEGKSTTTTNLAISFAQLGKKVVIIDCDLRLPTVNKKLGLPGTPGLSNLLIGDCSLQDACQIDKAHNMYVIPAGNIPPEPTWLLQSDKMKSLIEDFKGRVDYIFIDLPPVTVVTDAQMLSELIDGYLLVVQSESTSMSKITETVSALRLVDAKILGFVNTKSDAGKGSTYYKSYKKHGYYYSYGGKESSNE